MGVACFIGYFFYEILFTHSLSLPQNPFKADGTFSTHPCHVFYYFVLFHALGHSPKHTRITPCIFVHVCYSYPPYSPFPYGHVMEEATLVDLC